MTLIGHAVSGAAIYTALRPWGHQKSLFGLPQGWAFWLAVLVPLLPDLDAFSAIWWDPDHVVAHRGLSHSLLVGAALSLVGVLGLQATGRMNGGRRTFLLATGFFSLLFASHGCTDAMTDGGKGVMLGWPVSDARTFLPWRPLPAAPLSTTLVRTQWTEKQRRAMARYRKRVLDDDTTHNLLKRAAVSLDDDPTEARRLALVGIALTEVLVFAPLFFIGWWRRRRRPPEPPPIEYKRLATITAWVVPKPNRTVGAVLASACGVVFVIGLVFSRAPHLGLEHSRIVLVDGHFTPAFIIRPKTDTVPAPYALLLHDWRSGHEAMLPFARMLGRNGLEVVSVDWLGHSAHRTPLDLSCPPDRAPPCRLDEERVLRRQLDNILAALQNVRRFSGRPIILIGHELGARAALRAQHPAVTARVALATDIDERRFSGNALILAPRHARRDLPARIKVGRIVGDTRAGKAYAVHFHSLSSSGFLHDEDINRRVLDWVQTTTGERLAPPGAPDGDDEPDLRPLVGRSLLAVLFGLLFALACLHFLLSLFTEAVPRVLDRRANLARPLVAFFCCLVGLLASARHFGAWADSGPIWLWAEEGLLIPPGLFTFLLWGAIPYLTALLLKTRGDPEGRSVLIPRPLPLLAVLLAVTLHGVLVLGVADGALAPVSVPVFRVGRWALFTAMLFPFARVVQDVGPQALRPGPWATRLLLRCGLWAGAAALLAYGRSTVDERTLALVGAAVVGEAFGAVVQRHTGSRFAAALTVATICAAAFAALYPMLVATSA